MVELLVLSKVRKVTQAIILLLRLQLLLLHIEVSLVLLQVWQLLRALGRMNEVAM